MKKFYCLLIDSLSQTYGGPCYGTKYDLSNACDFCGTGAKPIGPLISSGLNKKKKNIFKNLDGEVFLDLELTKEFQKLGIKTLTKVISPRGMVFPFMEMRAEATLPPWDKRTKGFVISKQRQCPHCKRDGYFDARQESFDLVYDHLGSKLVEKDILTTYEHYGLSCLREPSKDSVFASPRYIISERIVDIFQKRKIKRVEFLPVTILKTT